MEVCPSLKQKEQVWQEGFLAILVAIEVIGMLAASSSVAGSLMYTAMGIVNWVLGDLVLGLVVFDLVFGEGRGRDCLCPRKYQWDLGVP